MTVRTQVLSDKEVRKILLNTLVANGETGMSKEDCEKIAEWAEQTRVSGTLLEMALSGAVGLGYTGTEVKFMLLTPDKTEKLLSDFQEIDQDDEPTDDEEPWDFSPEKP